jgi:small subunit ribosomal protein S27e
MKADVPVPKSKFLEVECKKCKEKTIVFSKSSTQINCDNCGEEIALPTGGKAYIVGKVLKTLD